MSNRVEHVFLTAITVETDESATRQYAEQYLHFRMPAPGLRRPADEKAPCIESWWIAEDVRNDGSDNDSAVFVKPGMQEAAVALLREHGLAY